MPRNASELARRLARDAEAVCRHYLSNGRRQGRYWTVGDVRNTPGRSMFVRLNGPEAGPGAAGNWADGATAEYGDLLDVIRESCGFIDFREVADEARRFLRLPHTEPYRSRKSVRTPVPAASPEAAQRLFAMSQPVAGTIAEIYLRKRGITALHDLGSLRFHPRCYYRTEGSRKTRSLPAVIAAVTDLKGDLTGVHRTWLASNGSGKASVATPRRAMGDLLGFGVRFGRPGPVIAAGEGIETALSVRSGFPLMPMVAALSAAHLAAIRFPAELRRLYVLRDRDSAGNGARDSLLARAEDAGIEAIELTPVRGDFNDDLRAFGLHALREALKDQLHPEDTARFWIG